MSANPRRLQLLSIATNSSSSPDNQEAALRDLFIEFENESPKSKRAATNITQFGPLQDPHDKELSTN